MTTALERAARNSWAAWATYRKFTRCSSCGFFVYCGATQRGTRWLCVDCFDLKRRPL